jgi:hypothetical protein
MGTADERQLRHGGERLVGRGRLVVLDGAVAAVRYLPLLANDRRRPWHQPLRAVGPALLGQRHQHLGAGPADGEHPVQQQRDRPACHGACPSAADAPADRAVEQLPRRHGQ